MSLDGMKHHGLGAKRMRMQSATHTPASPAGSLWPPQETEPGHWSGRLGADGEPATATGVKGLLVNAQHFSTSSDKASNYRPLKLIAEPHPASQRSGAGIHTD